MAMPAEDPPEFDPSAEHIDVVETLEPVHLVEFSVPTSMDARPEALALREAADWLDTHEGHRAVVGFTLTYLERPFPMVHIAMCTASAETE